MTCSTNPIKTGSASSWSNEEGREATTFCNPSVSDESVWRSIALDFSVANKAMQKYLLLFVFVERARERVIFWVESLCRQKQEWWCKLTTTTITHSGAMAWLARKKSTRREATLALANSRANQQPIQPTAAVGYLMPFK